jgi:2-iminobutanoate/2-iminopropanoate deaminase
MKKLIQCREAPAAIGPYSQAIESHGIVYCSGQIALDPKTGAIDAAGIEAETRRVLENIREVLAAAVLRLEDVVKTTIFLVDLADFDIVNRVYGEHFSAPYPARSTVQVAALPRKAKVEIEAIAMKRG